MICPGAVRRKLGAMRCTLLVACALAAGCQNSGGAAFEVVGATGVTAAPRGPVIALWEIRTVEPSYFVKYGDGMRFESQFSLTWDADPPAEVLDVDGIGVAIFALLPDTTVVADGEYDLIDLPIRGISADTAVVYKSGATTAPAWAAALPPRFSCARCVRSPDGTGDSFELAPCASVTIGGPAAPLCDW